MKHPPADLRLFYLQRPAISLPGIPETQAYFPALEVLFPSIVDQTTGSPTLAASELILDVSASGVGTVEDLVKHTQRQTPIWIRAVHLVEPISYMDGTYVLPRDGALPANSLPWKRALRKINDPYNEAYTDAIMACMASRLVETGRSPHFCRFFGTFNGRVPEYTYNITDDMPDIEGESWFSSGLQSGAFRVVAVDAWDPSICADITRPWEDVRRKLNQLLETESVSDEGALSADDGSADDGDSVSSNEKCENRSVDELTIADDIPSSGSVMLQRPVINLKRLDNSPASGSGSGSDSTDSESSADDVEYNVVLKEFPVQLTVLERCDGTMDELMEAEEDTDEAEKEARWTAWIFQVIAGLTVAQQTYNFVHNDLHTNNVMWSSTGDAYVYYQVGAKYYRVPTYGRIMKIIDFGRATFCPSASTSANRVWLPDAYAPDGDAHGQYNCGAYFQKKTAKILPNRSFDLCRLAAAILETLWPVTPAAASPSRILTREPERVQHETVSPLWNLMWTWLTDRNGKNVLLSPDGSERYPDFELYCAIARDVQGAVPAQQLTLPLFARAFSCSRADIPTGATIWKL